MFSTFRGIMKFYFFGIFASVTACHNQSAEPVNFEQSQESNATLWSKLKNYQNVTGISEETMMSIWQKSMNIRSGVRQGKSRVWISFFETSKSTFNLIQYLNLLQGGYPKFRVSTFTTFSETVNPIKYEIVNYNDQMEYNNGVIIIMQPGWYTFTASILGPYQDNSYSVTEIWIMVDNSQKTYCKRLVGVP